MTTQAPTDLAPAQGMTNIEFYRWRVRSFRSRNSCAKALELDRYTVESLETGRTRKGASYPVRRHIALACAMWDAMWDASQINESSTSIGTTQFAGPFCMVQRRRPGGWSLHAPGATDEQIASGVASCILAGDGRPTVADFVEAFQLWRAQNPESAPAAISPMRRV